MTDESILPRTGKVLGKGQEVISAAQMTAACKNSQNCLFGSASQGLCLKRCLPAAVTTETGVDHPVLVVAC